MNIDIVMKLLLVGAIISTSTMASEILAEQHTTSISTSAVLNETEAKTVILDENTTVVTDGQTAKIMEKTTDEKGVIYYILVTIFLPITLVVALILAPVYLIKGHRLDPKGETTEGRRAARAAKEALKAQE